jgi:hypothetical protein
MIGKCLKTALLGFCGALLTAGAVALAAAEIPQDKAVITFTGKLGTVTFNHQHHAELVDVGGVSKVECSTCHHKTEAGDTPQPCEECHAKKDGEKMENAPNIKDAYHLRCRGCHKYTMEEMGKEAGPDKKCKLCHVKEKK